MIDVGYACLCVHVVHGRRSHARNAAAFWTCHDFFPGTAAQAMCSWAVATDIFDESVSCCPGGDGTVHITCSTRGYYSTSLSLSAGLFKVVRFY
jgi:hypothetical protein